MTNYIKYISLIAAAAVATAACKKEQPQDDPSQRPVTQLEMSFQKDGQKVKVLKFSPLAQKANVDLVINNENLKWTLESDKSWCRIENASGKGSSNITLDIDMNESATFSPRDTAHIVFRAGAYTSQDTLKIWQSSTTFIISQPYFVSAKGGQSWTNITVKSPKGVGFTTKGPEWVSYEQTRQTETETVRTTTLKITSAANEGASRYEPMNFFREDSEEVAAVMNFYQFGSETTYDESGNILMPAEVDSKFTFTAPANIVNYDKGITVAAAYKDVVSVSHIERPDGNVDVSVHFKNNLNDCMETRSVKNAYLTLYNNSRCVLPAIMQPYASSHAISTGKGMLAFAKAVNAGQSTEDWESNGVVKIANNIDMTSVSKSWVSIGNEEHPFTGKFDGTYHAISGLTSDKPLFGVCQGATITAVLVDDTNVFKFSEDPTSEEGILMASVVGDARACIINDCTNNAKFTLDKTILGENISVHIGGIAGKADADTRITKCENNGSITIATGMTTTNTANTMYVGGIVAENSAAVKECTNNGAIADGAYILNHFDGGIAGLNNGAIADCANNASFSVTSARNNSKAGIDDASKMMYIGGIAARTTNEITNCANKGNIVLASDVKIFYAGGIAAQVKAAGLGLNGNTNSGNIETSGMLRYLYAGGLYGSLEGKTALSWSGSEEASTGDITISGVENSSAGVIIVGGIIGRVNADLELNMPLWSRSITLDFSKSAHQIASVSVGGIVGGAYSPFDEASAPGDMKIRNAQNSKGSIIMNLAGANAYGARWSTLSGIVAVINGQAEITDCINTGDVLMAASGGQSNAYSSYVSGVVGRVWGGNATISGCTNNGGLRNWHYNNNPNTQTWTSASGIVIYTCNQTSGILGGFMPTSTSTAYTCKITNCTNTGFAYSYRGGAAGILGYGRNTTISGCNNSGSLGSGNRYYVGGIAAILEGGKVENSTATALVLGQNAGSGIFAGGGIVSKAIGSTTITGCSYFGDITFNYKSSGTAIGKGECYGGIAGTTESKVTITGCKFGGTLNGVGGENVTVELNEENFANYVTGDGLAAVSGCSYWDGK